MELSYWESRWRKGKTGFHMPDGYPGLKKFWPIIGCNTNCTVLVPLCGKSLDMVQLEQFGAKVIGIEISEKAIVEFFDEQNRTFETDSFGEFIIRRSGNIEIWQGDFLKFPSGNYPEIDVIYDKAALIALPNPMRTRYVNKVLKLTGDSTSVLLHHFIYPQEQMPGPPFSVSAMEIECLFSANFRIIVLEENTIPSENFRTFKRRGLESPLIERLLHLSSLS